MEEKMELEIRNARITGTMLGIEDHGILTCWLYLDYGGSGQGFGGIALDEYDSTLGRRVGWKYGMEFIVQILKIVDVSKWEDLSGKHIRVQYSANRIHAIGNILENKWFWPEKFVGQ